MRRYLRSMRLRTLGLAIACFVGLGFMALSTPAQSKIEPVPKDDAAPKSEPAPKGVKSVQDVLAPGIGGLNQVNYINELLEKNWNANKISPSARCTDYEFIRRASLDIIGRIAKVSEIDRFMKDPAPTRRSLLIERLLNDETYADNWAGIWTTILITRTKSTTLAQEQMRDWFAEKLTEEIDPKTKKETYTPDWSKIVTEILTASGQTNDNPAVNYFLTHLGEMTKPQEKIENGAWDMVPATSWTTRVFLGVRTKCVQCHDHPFNNDLGQHQFWGVNAFLRQLDTPRGRPTMMPANNKKKGGGPVTQFALIDNTQLNPKAVVPYERRNGVLLYTDPTFLDGRKMKLKGSQDSRRAELAKFIIGSPNFAKAYVNRMWEHFFGLSFTKDAVDDFGDHNPVTNPELLDRLADDWINSYAYNPKDLIRWICNSRAYGLSSTANKTNDKHEDEIFFSRMLLKAMSPEQLFESLMTATQAKVNQNKAAKQALLEKWQEKLVASFGDDEGNEINYNGTVVQALILMNGPDINMAINDKETGTVAAVLQKRANTAAAAKGAMQDLYLAGLNRPPRADEFTKMLSPKMYVLPQGNPSQAPAVFWTGFYQDLFWAILNSNEFYLNH